MTDTELYIAFWAIGLIIFIRVGWKLAGAIDRLTDAIYEHGVQNKNIAEMLEHKLKWIGTALDRLSK